MPGGIAISNSLSTVSIRPSPPVAGGAPADPNAYLLETGGADYLLKETGGTDYLLLE